MVTYDFGGDLIQGKTYSCSVKASDIQAETQDTKTPIFPVAPPNYPLVSRQMTVGQIIFSDNLESGLGNWIPDPAYYPWQLTEDGCVSPTHSVYVWDDRKHDPYGGNNNLTLKQPLDLSKDGSYYLTFWHNYRLDQSFVLWVEVSTDGGANWNWVGRYGSYDHWDNYSTEDFVQEVLDLNDYAGEDQVLLRFRFDWTAGWYYSGVWYLDDIKVFQCGCPCDVSGDGELTPQDALCAFQTYLGICPTACGPCEDICCDVNMDEDCTPADALEIFREYLGLPSCLDSSG